MMPPQEMSSKWRVSTVFTANKQELNLLNFAVVEQIEISATGCFGYGDSAQC